MLTIRFHPLEKLKSLKIYGVAFQYPKTNVIYAHAQGPICQFGPIVSIEN